MQNKQIKTNKSQIQVSIQKLSIIIFKNFTIIASIDFNFEN